MNTFLHDPVITIPYTQTTHHHVPIPESLTNWAVSDYATMLKQDLSHHHGSSYGFTNLLTKKQVKKPAKKDRHSKIHTSQGLRDRRVRLSIEIARKFFDLQDMLGFDKASNTLEWLFNKSKEAIEELTISKNPSANVDDYDANDDVNNDDDSFSSSSCEDMIDNKERKMKRVVKETSKMKDLRGKARARARERTNEKMQEDLKEKYVESENPQQILHQLMPNDDENNISKSQQPRLVHHLGVGGGEFQRDDIFNFIEESIVIKRKLKKSSVSSSSNSHHQQNNLISKEPLGFDNHNNDCHESTMSPNWDANNAGRSNFSSISRMNLSSGLSF